MTAPQGVEWAVAPHLAGLSGAQGGFETPLGRYDVQWTLKTSGSAGEKTFSISVQAPPGTTGTITLPVDGQTELDGKRISSPSGSLTLEGGSHSILVTTRST